MGRFKLDTIKDNFGVHFYRASLGKDKDTGGRPAERKYKYSVKSTNGRKRKRVKKSHKPVWHQPLRAGRAVCEESRVNQILKDCAGNSEDLVNMDMTDPASTYLL